MTVLALLRRLRTVAHVPASLRIAGALLVLGSLLAWPATSSAADPSPSPAPAEVTVGAYIHDIQEIDLLTHSYAMDAYVWLRWKDPSIDPSKSLELMNPYELWSMSRTPAYAEPQTLPDGSQYQVIRFQGTFSSKLPLADYPLDRQSLDIVFEDDAHDETSIVYVPDGDPIDMNPDVTLPGYDIGTPTLTVSNSLYPTTFGDTSEDRPYPYSRVTIAVPVSRPAIAYLVKIAVPIFLVVLVAALSYLLHSSYVEARVGMGITALVALVALQFSMNTTMPQVGYLTALDLVYIASFAFVLAVMAQAVATSWLAHKGEHARAVALDRRMVLVAGGVYALAIAVIFFVAAL
jgi:hypothetical protein